MTWPFSKANQMTPAKPAKGGPACYGGRVEPIPVHKYSEPKGPKGINDKGAGLGGTNHGPAGTQRKG